MSIQERSIAATLGLAILGGLGFIVAYTCGGDHRWMGLSATVAFVGFLLAALGWARWLVPREQVVDEIVSFASENAEREAALHATRQGEMPFLRSALLTRLLLGALGVVGLAMLLPIRSLGPAPGRTLFSTRWRLGLRALREDGRPLKRGDLEVGSVVTVFPEGAIGDARSQALVLRLPDGKLDGLQAYSKVCTHAGCPVALYRAATEQLLCPCHQSLFDVRADGRVVSGPADRPLPRLPIAFDTNGFLIALGDFPVPVGPGFWQDG